MTNNTSSDQENFESNGYLIMDNAFTLEDLSAFKNLLHQTIYNIIEKYKVKIIKNFNLSIEEECDYGIIELSKINPDYTTEIQAIISRSPEYFRLCSSPATALLIKKLMGVDKASPIYLTNNGIIFTNPNDEENPRSSNISIGWHKDTFFTIPHSRFLHVWAPLIHDANQDIGTLKVCVGSHKKGVGTQKINPLAQYDHRYSMDIKEVEMYPSKSIELKVGQALIFDGNLIHRSGANISNHVRFTLIGLHHDASYKDFKPIIVEYKYKEKTPEEFYYEVFNDSDALPLLKEQLLK